MKISLTIVYYVVKKWCALIKRKKKNTFKYSMRFMAQRRKNNRYLRTNGICFFFGILKEKFDKQEMI